jgi:predicted transcriptional regulator
MYPSRRQHINRLAETVLSTCELSVPIPMDEAVRRLRGDLAFVAKADFEAKIEKTDTGFRITLPQDGYEPRERFSIAHELGHLFLHMGYLVDEAKWNSIEDYTDSVYYRYGYSVEESEANEFAGAFLMPRAEFARVAQQHQDGDEYDITRIAEQFNVSAGAAVTRGRFLGLFRWE